MMPKAIRVLLVDLMMEPGQKQLISPPKKISVQVTLVRQWQAGAMMAAMKEVPLLIGLKTTNR